MAAASPGGGPGASRSRTRCARPAAWAVASAAALRGVAAEAAAVAVEDDGPTAGPEDQPDPICFDGSARTREKCCGHRPHTGPCTWGGILSGRYCCPGEDPEQCFTQGVVILGADVGEPVMARTGLECRHVCQSTQGCVGWTFLQAGFQDEQLRYSCWVKDRLSSEEERDALRVVVGAVSGSRHCPPGWKGVLASLRHRRTMDLTQEPDGGVVRPHADPAGYAAQAASKLLTNGWVVLRGALGDQETAALGRASDAALQELLARDGERIGNRGPRRYSLGSASKSHHMVHVPEWASLIDNPVITPVLRAAFGGSNDGGDGGGYVAIGGGGDVVLGDTDSVQWLHVDLPRMEMYMRQKPPPGVGVNFAVHDVDCDSGAMRLVSGTHTVVFQLDKMWPANETAMLEDMGLRRVFVCPMKRGDVLLRDLRIWHAGSANLKNTVRLSPNTEYLSTWYADATEGSGDHLAPRRVLPRRLWSGLSEHGRRITERAVTDGDVDPGFHDQLGIPQQYD